MVPTLLNPVKASIQNSASIHCAGRIVFVDDDLDVLKSMERTLRSRQVPWNVKFLSSSVEAWEFVQRNCVDLVVSDVSMPHMNGLELLRQLRDNPATRNVAVLIMTGREDDTLERQVLEFGATDLLCKPVRTDLLLARISSSLKLKQAHDQLRQQNERLERMVADRTRQLEDSRTEIVLRLAKAAELQDEETGHHVLRVACYSRIIASVLRMPVNFQESLFLAAPLHDLGKLGIPAAILKKPGSLTDEERAVVQGHCEIGERLLSEQCPLFEHWLGRNVTAARVKSEPDVLLRTAREIAASHHEWWNGRGYPRGLAGAAIPLTGRIVAVADVFDALTSPRPYKPAFSLDRSIAIIREGEGTQFDPQVVRAFLDSMDEIEEVYLQLRMPDSNSKPEMAAT